jgi:hypothetical protein
MLCMKGREGEGGTDFKLEIQDGRHLRGRGSEGGDEGHGEERRLVKSWRSITSRSSSVPLFDRHILLFQTPK